MAIEKRVRIIHDSASFNPRKEYDCHAGRMICWHHRYDLGDEHSYNREQFLEELACEADSGVGEKIDHLENVGYDNHYEYAKENDINACHEYAAEKVRIEVDELCEKVVHDNFIMLPLYLYDHSGITMSTGSLGCEWDSCQVGWIICDKKTIDADFGGDHDKAVNALRNEVKVYDHYLTGDVYGFVVEERETVDCPCCERPFSWVETDSCWGFYGSNVRENGMADHLGDELTKLAEIE